MDTETKRSRVELYKKLNFRGVSDWAIDLSGGYDPTANRDEDPEAASEIDCDFDLKFNDLQDLEKNGGSLSSYCTALYTLDLLSSMFTEAVSKYEDLDKNYDSRFDYYVKAVKAVATANLNKCLSWTDSGPCNKHFTCTWRQDGEDKETGKCPLTKYEVSQDKSFIITYKMDDEASFNKTLEEDFGVNPEWVELTDILNDSDCNGVGAPPGANPRPQEDDPDLERRQCIQVRQEYRNRPVLRDDAKIPNPKDVVKAASENFEDMLLEITASYIEILFGVWEGDASELVEAISMPVLMVVQSVEIMEDVKEIGEDVEQQEREQKTKDIIFAVLLAAFIFIPIAGEAAFALGWTSVTIARLATMIGLAGDAAMTAYDAFEDPQSALMMALLMLIPIRGVSRDDATVKRIMQKKRDFKGAALNALGDVFKKHDTSVQNILDVCKRV